MSGGLRACDFEFLAGAGIAVHHGPDLETLSISSHSSRDSGRIPESYLALLICIDHPHSTRDVHDYLNGRKVRQ